MNFIKNKKVHKNLMIGLLLLSFSFTDFYSTRGVLSAYSAYLFPFNDIIAFVVAGIVGGLIFEGVIALITRFAAVKMGEKARDMKYALRFFIIPANVLSGLVKLLYFKFPFIFSYGEIFIDFIFMAIAFSLYAWFCCRAYCKKQEYAKVVMFVGSTFLGFYGIIAAVSLLAGVIA